MGPIVHMVNVAEYCTPSYRRHEYFHSDHLTRSVARQRVGGLHKELGPYDGVRYICLDMKPFEQLSFREQGRRLRKVADAALAHYELHAPRLTVLSHRHDTIFRVDTSDGAKYVLRVYGPGDL